jgi:membrane associated rhomboid family serine protease
MIPIGDRNPTRRVAVVNLILIVANVLIFFYELSLSNRELELFINTWGVRSTEVMGLLGGDVGLLIPVLLKSLVSMFLHGGWLHLISNMLFLWIFGDNIEDNFGSGAYIVFYLLSGAGAVLVQAFVTPNSPVPAIGASGAISGVMAAYLLLYPTASIRALIPFLLFIPVLVPAWAMIILWFVSQVFNGLASITDDAMMTGGVAYGAHVGGFVAGFILAFFFRRPDRRPKYQYYDYIRR